MNIRKWSFWARCILCLSVMFFLKTTDGIAGGDLNKDGSVNLKDGIIALQIASDANSPEFKQIDDVNGDDKVGLEEAVYALQCAAGFHPSRNIRITGQITGSGGLAEVLVSAGGVTSNSDANGFYKLEDVPVPAGNRVIITWEKQGYATYQKALTVAEGTDYAVSAKLNVFQIIENVDQTVLNPLEAKDGEGSLQVRFDLPANSLSDAAPGNIKVGVALGDPSTDEGRSAFPGNYMAASTASATPDTPLESIAFTEITITDSTGKEITQLTTPAEVTIRLPETYQTGGEKAGTYSDGSTIEWWSYNETSGIWLREDADPSTPETDDADVVAIDGVLYAKGKVTHLTWWNADRPLSEHACLCVYVVDDENAPLGNIEVTAQGISYDSTSDPAITDNNGRACINVKRTENTQKPETVSVLVRAGSVRFPYDVTDVAEGNVDTDAIFVGSTICSTLDNVTDDCTVLSNKIQVAFTGKVQGTVAYESNRKPIPDFMIYSSFGPTATTNANGYYELNVPLNVEFLLYAPGLASKSVNVSSTAPVTVDFLIPNRPPVIDSVTVNPITKVEPGQQVTFTGAAHDDDGDAITYAWTASQGTLSSASGTQTVWTAPAGIGTAVVTLTVRDLAGLTATEARSALWGGTGSAAFSVTVKDTPENNLPVAGVYVIVHGTDQKSVESFKVTGSDGIADFSELGPRDRITWTIADQTETQYPQMTSKNTDLTTYVNVPSGNIVYYVHQSQNYFCTASDTMINVTLTGLPTGSTPQLFPIGGFSENNTDFLNVPVCENHIQNDGKISILGIANAENHQMTKYGFIEDAVLGNGSSYTVPLDRDPLEIAYASENGIPVSTCVIIGNRKGVSYSLAYVGHETAQATGTGIVNIPNEFPVESYTISSSSDNQTTGNTATSMKRYDTLPTSLSLPFPAFQVDELYYDPQTKTFTWTVTGSTEKDFASAEISGWSYTMTPDFKYVQIASSWTIMINGDATGCTVPNIPSAIESWFDFTKINHYNVDINDVDVFSNLDTLYNFYIAGNDVKLDSRWTVTAGMNVDVQPGKRAVSTPVSEPSAKDPLSGFKGLLRR